MSNIILGNSIFKEIANKYLSIPSVMERVPAIYFNPPASVTEPDAGAVYGAAEQALLNQVKEVVNSNADLQRAMEGNVVSLSSIVTQLQGLLSAIARIVSNQSQLRNTSTYRGSVPVLTAPGAADIATVNDLYNQAETILTPANVSTLVKKWETAPGSIYVYNMPMVVNDIVYSVESSGVVSARREVDGVVQELWQYRCGESVSCTLVVTADRVVVFDFAGQLHLLERSTGNCIIKFRPNPHVAAGFYGHEGFVDVARNRLYFTSGSIEEGLMGLQFAGNNTFAPIAITGCAIGAVAPGVFSLACAPGTFTQEDTYREISISGSGVPGNDVQFGFILSVPVAFGGAVCVFQNAAGSALGALPVGAMAQISDPFIRQTYGLKENPGARFAYETGCSVIPGLHAIDLATGDVKWDYWLVNDSNFTPTVPGGTMVDAYNPLGAKVVGNLPGSFFGYPPGIPSTNGYNIYDPNDKALDKNGDKVYSLGPSVGNPYGGPFYDASLDMIFIATDNHMSPPLVNASGAVIAIRASDGKHMWTNQIANDVVLPDIWTDHMSQFNPAYLTRAGTVSLSAPDADGYQTLTDAGAPFVATDGAQGRQANITGFANAVNNGKFNTAVFVDASNIKILNPDGVAEAVGGTVALHRIYDCGLANTPQIVTTAGNFKYLIVLGKSGRMSILNPTTGAIVTEKQLFGGASGGGFWLTGALVGDKIYVTSNDWRVNQVGTKMGITQDVTQVKAQNIGCFQIDDAGAIVKIWTNTISNSGADVNTVQTGPLAGSTFSGVGGFAPFIANGVMYSTPGFSKYLYCHDINTGALITKIAHNTRCLGTPTVSNGRVYIQTGQAFSPIWKLNPEFYVLSGKVMCFGLPA